MAQKLVFPFPCFCAVTSASVHLPGKWEGQELALWQQRSWPGQAGLAQPGLFPQDDITPSGELMRAAGAWHMGLSHLQFRAISIFQIKFPVMCFPVPHFLLLPSTSSNREFNVLFFGLLCACISRITHVCTAAIVMQLSSSVFILTFLHNASFSPEIENLKTTSQCSFEAEGLFFIHWAYSFVPSQWADALETSVLQTCFCTVSSGETSVLKPVFLRVRTL